MYCYNCGKENKQGNSFCTNCGTKLAVQNNNTNNVQPTEQKKNICAIIGIIVTLLLSAFIGLILSIVGLTESKKINSGKTLSIVGIVLAVLKLIAEIIILVILIIVISSEPVESVTEDNYIYDQENFNTTDSLTINNFNIYSK